jgi:hypothetical protein
VSLTRARRQRRVASATPTRSEALSPMPTPAPADSHLHSHQAGARPHTTQVLGRDAIRRRTEQQGTIERPRARASNQPHADRGTISREGRPRTESAHQETRAHWQQVQRWFWFTENGDMPTKELVVPLGEQYENGPHMMTRFRTQDGRIRSCSIDYFERNTEICTTMRRLAS